MDETLRITLASAMENLGYELMTCGPGQLDSSPLCVSRGDQSLEVHRVHGFAFIRIRYGFDVPMWFRECEGHYSEAFRAIGDVLDSLRALTPSLAASVSLFAAKGGGR